jgi:Ion transport protein
MQVPLHVALLICSHYIIRKGCEAISLLSLSVRCFRAYFTNIWTFLDVLTIISVMIAMIWNDRHPYEYRGGWNALVTGFLWIRVLGYLKVINQQMATFIMALAQILKDLRFFAVVLIVCIFMFGDMMQIAVSSKDNGQFCANNDIISGPVQDFCSGSRTAAVLRT